MKQNIEVYSFTVIKLSSVFSGLPSTGVSVKQGPQKQAAAAGATGGAGATDADADLEARLENLRRQ